MMNFKIKYLVVLCLAFSVFACNDDDDKCDTEKTTDNFEGCCSPDPVFGANVDNLDQSAGEIKVINLFTPNSDGYYDTFEVKNIMLYPNHTVTIYNNDEEMIFESINYGSSIEEVFPLGSQGESGSDDFADGTYKFKVVVENEQTFFKSGTFCLFTNNPEIEQNFSECNSLENGFDPIISGQ